MLAVVYLIFNEGYGGRGELAAEAIRLGRALAQLMPDEPDVHALLALMLINDARRDARFADGAVVLLATRIARSGTAARSRQGQAALERALALGGRGAYVLQAAIAALHVDEPQDWPQLAALYGELARLTGSPVVELNRAAAIAEAGDVEAALALVDQLELDGYHYLHSTRAELLRRLGRVDEPAPPTTARSSSSTRTPSGASSSSGWPSCKADRSCALPVGYVSRLSDGGVLVERWPAEAIRASSSSLRRRWSMRLPNQSIAAWRSRATKP